MVEMTYLALIGIALAAMFFGYGFGLFEGRSQGYKKRKREEGQEAGNQPAPEPRTPSVDDPGLLRIKSENGTLTLDLDGTRVNTTALQPEERRRLIEMLNLMRPWLEARMASAPAQPGPAPLKSAADDARKPAAPKPAPQAQANAKADDDRPAAPANSIVAQIDAILQVRMAGTPLADRRIFLAQAPDGGVVVHVGVTRYNGVEEVPDDDIKAAIRAAIAEWEKKYTPGL